MAKQRKPTPPEDLHESSKYNRHLREEEMHRRILTKSSGVVDEPKSPLPKKKQSPPGTGSEA
jgi:hypothetical protein